MEEFPKVSTEVLHLEPSDILVIGVPDESLTTNDLETLRYNFEEATGRPVLMINRDVKVTVLRELLEEDDA